MQSTLRADHRSIWTFLVTKPRMIPRPTVLQETFSEFVYQIQALICFFVVLPLFFLLTVLSLAIRTFVILIARFLRPDLIEICNQNGAVCVAEKVATEPRFVVLNFGMYEGFHSLDKIRQDFQNELLDYCDSQGQKPYTHLKQYWTNFLGFFFWKDEQDFKLSNHVRLYDYKEPKFSLPLDSWCTEQDLERIGGSLITKPFPQGQSPWELLLVPKYKGQDGTEGCAVLFRIHHNLADGYSMMEMSNRIFGLKFNIHSAKFVRQSLFKRVAQTILVVLRLPWDLATIMFHWCDVPNAWNLHGQPLDKNYYAYFADGLPVAKIKSLAKRYGACYNALIYSIGAGIVMRMIEEAGHDAPEKLSVIIPVPLADHPGGLTNHMTTLAIFFDPRKKDPMRRLKELSDQVRPASVFIPITETAYWTMRILAYFPSFISQLFLTPRLQTLGMTSMPGPPVLGTCRGSTTLVDYLSLLGRPASLHGGAVLTMESYAGKQRITVLVNKAVLGGRRFPFNLNKHIQEELEALTHPQSFQAQVEGK